MQGLLLVSTGAQPQPSWSKLFGLTCPANFDPEFVGAWDHRIHLLVTARLRDPLRHLEANVQLGALVAGLLAHYGDKPSSGQQTTPVQAVPLVIIKLESLLAQSLSSGLSISDAARKLGYSASYLSRLYTRSRGRSTTAYLRSLRVQRACKLMHSKPQLPLVEIARSVGLHTDRSLHRCFKEEIGQSPDAWRRSQHAFL